MRARAGKTATWRAARQLHSPSWRFVSAAHHCPKENEVSPSGALRQLETLRQSILAVRFFAKVFFNHFSLLSVQEYSPQPPPLDELKLLLFRVILKEFVWKDWAKARKGQL